MGRYLLEKEPDEFRHLYEGYGRRANKLRRSVRVMMLLVVVLVLVGAISSLTQIFFPRVITEVESGVERIVKETLRPPPPKPSLYWNDVALCQDAGLAVGSDGIALHSQDDGGSWSVVESGTGSDLNRIAFAKDCRSALVAGDDGALLRFSDEVLSRLETHAVDDFTDIAWSVDGQTVAAVGTNGLVRVSKDGGDVWNDPGNVAGQDLNAVAVSADGGTVVVAGDRRTLAYSTQSGRRDSWMGWTIESGREGTDFEAVAFNGQGTAVAVGEDGFIWTFRTGVWKDVSATRGDGKDFREDFNAVAFSPNGETAVAVGDDGLAWSSAGDNLTNWAPGATRIGHDLNDVAAGPAGRTFVAVGDAGRILLSIDQGKSWCAHDSRTTSRLYAVAFSPTEDEAFAAGRDEQDQAEFLRIDSRDCSARVIPIKTDFEGADRAPDRGKESDPMPDSDMETAAPNLVDHVFGFSARILGTFLLLYLVHHMIGLIRYNLRLAAFYDARGDALLMTDPARPPLSDSIRTFRRIVNVLSPRDIDFGRMSDNPTTKTLTKTLRLLQKGLRRRKRRKSRPERSGEGG